MLVPALCSLHLSEQKYDSKKVGALYNKSRKTKSVLRETDESCQGERESHKQ